ncbi:MAG: uroporphyrinogen-III C-methyltransferase [Woeseiaceae bacterium]|nr:uroporphyrinogen-III C-methyltransferase [Woeseiaceae bacterium]
MTEENTSENEDASFGDVEMAGGAKRLGGGFIAWLALLLSVGALALAGLDLFRDKNVASTAADDETRVETLIASMEATQAVVSSLEASVSSLADNDAASEAAISRINRQLENRLRQIELVPGRLATVEASLASLQGISTGARDVWLLAEAEYYMQIANAQLQLANNPELAMLALTYADERIVQLGDPRLTSIRQALSDELRALEVVDKPDTTGITLTLASLASIVDSLPLRQEAAVQAAEATTGIDPELTGMDRAWASVRNAMDGVVKVRDVEDVSPALVAPEARYFLRANLSLQLQAARIALLRGEETIFRQSLDDADTWLGNYYDEDSTAVQRARETIAEIRDSVLRVSMPDISRSLQLLRQFNTLAEATGTPDEAETPDEVEQER